MRPHRAVRAGVWLYRGLLRLYPTAYRQRYGDEMAQTWRDMALAAQARHGLQDRHGHRALLRVWIAAVADLLISIPTEYVSVWRERRIMSRKSLGVLILALALSALTGYVNVTASEVQAPMLCILLFSFVTGLLQPRGAWRWAALIGLSIPASTFVGLAINFPFVDAPPRFPITLVVLVVPALIAAYLGVLSHRLLTAVPPHSSGSI